MPFIQTCAQCGQPFEATRGDAITCGVTCRAAKWRKETAARADDLRAADAAHIAALTALVIARGQTIDALRLELASR